MALKSPLMPSPTVTGAGHFASTFSSYMDSPHSPAAFSPSSNGPQRKSASSDTNLAPPPSPYPAFVDPSPVDSQASNDTENTEFDEEEQDNVKSPSEADDDDDIRSPNSAVDLMSPSSQGGLSTLDTSVKRVRSNSDNEPQSVIHIPSGFKRFEHKQPPSESDKNSNSPVGTERSEQTVISPFLPNHHSDVDDRRYSLTSPIDTNIPPAAKSALDHATPRAQTRQEAELDAGRKSRASVTLEGIPEGDDKADDEFQDAPQELAEPETPQSELDAQEQADQTEKEVAALKTALTECWTLCNTLAGLSSNHRERMFQFTGQGSVQEQAWRSCWRLCQKLYETRDQDHASQVRPTLELCKDFCQALFEARQKGDETADSVLRVSFELNNHLYNTHDRNLPEAFRERTLDFYLTLCHRLMKQRTSLPEETDSLLRACWSLAEMLFSIRQNRREGKPEDEELIGSAVQACWELCDLFREGWSQVRPDRGTPKPIYPARLTSFATSNNIVRTEIESRSSSVDYTRPGVAPPYVPPETPVTIFDDTTAVSSPADSIPLPNILVLGPEQGSGPQPRWSTSASSLSRYSDTSSQRTSSTATASGESTLIRLKCLILKAALNCGYPRPMSPNSSFSSNNSPEHKKSNSLTGISAPSSITNSPPRHRPGSTVSSNSTAVAPGRNSLQPSLPSFVSNLPLSAFGTLPWQTQLFAQYRGLVLADPTLRNSPDLPWGRRISDIDCARAVRAMAKTGRFEWLRELFRLVYGVGVDEVTASGRKSMGPIGERYIAT